MHVARLNSYFCTINNIVHVHNCICISRMHSSVQGRRALCACAHESETCVFRWGSPLLDHNKSRFCSCMKMVIFCVHRVADPTRCGRLFSIGTLSLLLIAAYHVPLVTGQPGRYYYFVQNYNQLSL